MLSFDNILESPHCTKKMGNISLSEQRSSLLIANKGCCMYEIKIDGGLIPYQVGQKKCDYLVIRDSDKKYIFIELKGTDIKKAMAQIICTIDQISINSSPRSGLIIARKTPMEGGSEQILRRKARKDHGLEFTIRSSPYRTKADSI
ncbi:MULTISPECIES: hypothetical protein [Proteus]|uniref:hypothetical protein n=1 Tax=Proteus TaxID=583 RepID=UPI001377F790|nr:MULTISPECIES: hypothetical protein [Proteus]MBG2839202.1 hypothetical protein [Proteus terrae subsp. cibarius]MBG2870379.1 hypothetical protein [Proteus terrae subsp. cibarius]NBN85276.1 hypothetical protein [Proteus sp. G2300]